MKAANAGERGLIPRRRLPRRPCYVVLLIFGSIAELVLARGTHAQTDPGRSRAKALLGEGLNLLEKHDYQGALQCFQHAYQIVPSPKIFFNLGQAYLGLGREPEALTNFETFLEQVPTAPIASRTAAAKKRDELRLHLGFLEAIADQDGTAIFVDEKQVGATPLARAIPLTLGQHEVKFHKEGFEPQSQTIALAPGQNFRVMAKLHLLANQPASPAPTKGPEVIGQVPGARSPPAITQDLTTKVPSFDVRPHPSRGSPPAWRRPTAWSLAGGAALSLGLGIGFQLASSSKNADFGKVNNASTPDMKCDDNPQVPAAGGPVCNQLRQDADRYHKIALTSFVVGGLLAIGSASLFFVSSENNEKARIQSLRCGPAGGISDLGIGCSMLF